MEHEGGGLGGNCKGGTIDGVGGVRDGCGIENADTEKFGMLTQKLESKEKFRHT